ncbi:ATP-binding cassette domain-containing protein [Vibrio sp. CAIM 722]|uniref:ATP-binding cassette domain-containing protein n=1 Tax=Vibrio eleionomae TaxID=2653505 RepID=A0A7X4LKK2_9VIBR|nr:ABC transporter ATP-binding protein [Vibrio eleionomae]MZI93614.1 ATP-binding cassette domain-containing protein [Vibrio eleionomae]
MQNTTALPSYLDQSEQVRARFDAIKQRPVILDVKDLCKSYPSHQGTVEALRNVNFQIHRREFVCVIGPSGCGKSSLIRTLAGLETVTSGEILIDGKPVDGPGQDRGMVFQGYTLFPWLTVKKNVMFGLERAGKSKMEAESDALMWLDLVSLESFADHYPHQLSGGMKQRVAIARSLATQPRMLLMDEPFGALDAQTRTKMQSHLLDIWKNIDITVLFITHDLDEAVFLADRILVLKAHPGEVQELIEVPVPHPRSLDQLNSPEFLATRARVDELIHPPVNEEDELDISSRIIRLTNVNDNVI